MVALNAAFAGTEMALVSPREGQVRRLARTSHRGQALARLVRDPRCPVLIARGTMDLALPVPLAADGSPANDPAVGFVFEEAAMRCAPLVALHGLVPSSVERAGGMQPLVYWPPLVDAEEAGILAEALADWRSKFPHVAVRRYR